MTPVMFLPVVVRELAVAARRQRTYSGRVWSALAAMLAGLAVLLWLFQLPVGEQGRRLFQVLSSLAFAYSLFAGARTTSDCISSEKREGTLGLLFLTDLKGYDVVLGKLVSSSLASVYGLLAMLPVLALGMLLGGVTGREMAIVALVLLNTLFFSLSAGVFVSTVSRVERKALFATLGLTLLVTLGPFPVAYYYTYGFGPDIGSLDTTFLLPSPIYAFRLAGSSMVSSVLLREFYCSVGTTHVIGWCLLGLAAVTLPRIIQDRPRGARRLRWHERWQQWSYGTSAVRQAFRARLLDRNPFFWLAGRDRLKANYVWLFLGLLGALWYLLYTQEPDLMLDPSISSGWLFFIFGFFKIWVASEVCARLTEDRRCGALELLLASPLSLREMARGQGLALGRQFALPVGLLMAAAVALLWLGVSRGPHLANRTETIAAFAAGLALVVADLWALKWVGMWLALTAAQPNRALIATTSRILAFPWVLFAGLYFSLWFVTEVILGRRVEPSPLNWICCWFVIGLGADLIFGCGARRKVLRDFRKAAEQRFDGSAKSGASSVVKFLSDLAALMARARATRRASDSRRVLRRYWSVWAVATITVLLLGWFAWFRISVTREVTARLAAIRAAQFPASLAEFNRWNSPVKPDENAALKILEASSAATLNPNTRTMIQSLGRNDPLPLPTKAEFTRLLSNNIVALQLVRQAAAFPRSRFPIDWSDPRVYQYPLINQVLPLGPLLWAESMMRAETGDLAEAAESITLAFAVAHLMAEEPYVTAQWFRHYFLSSTCSSLERLLSQHALQKPELERLLDGVTQAQGEPDFARVVAGQRAIDIDAFSLSLGSFFQRWDPNWVPRQSQQISIIGLVSSLLRVTGIRDKDLLFYLDGMEQWLALTRLPDPERLAKAKDVEQRIQSRLAERPLFVLSRHLLQSRLDLESRRAERLAFLRAAQAALAIELFRLEHSGTLPDTLGRLLPMFLKTIPVDPFDGRSLRYQQQELGYVVYSVGPDRRDDGGMVRHTKSRQSAEPDIIFVVGR